MLDKALHKQSEKISHRVPELLNSREVSCRVISAVIKYIESQGYDSDLLTKGLPYTKEYLKDSLNWVNYEIREIVCKRAAELTQNEAVMYEVAVSSPGLNSFGGLEHLVRLLGNPQIAYNNISKYAGLFDRTLKFKTTTSAENKVIISMSLPEGYDRSKSSCFFAQGMLAVTPTLWALPLAEVKEIRCICDFDFTDQFYSNPLDQRACIYEVTWQPRPPLRRRLLDNILRRNTEASATIRKLEDNFTLLDRKNAELTTKNLQLAKVREIALAIDSLKTRDQVYKTVVELARDIPGVRFVIQLKWDETKTFVTAPYYSKLRNKTLMTTLKTIGFDLTSALGDNSNSEKFKFMAADSKIALEWKTNPKVISKNSLAELVDGIWPKPLCNAIQKIVGIKNATIIPLMVDGESWGSLLFCLNDEVSLEILEMVGAHCSSAIKNIIAIQKLEQSNIELVALNKKANTALARQKQVENDLKQSEEKYKTIFDSANDVILMLDNKGKILDVNAKLKAIGGYEPETVIGQDFRSLTRIITKASIAKMAINIVKRMAGFNIHPYEVEMIKQDGGRVILEINAIAIRKEGKIIGDLAILRDITERKKAQSALIENEQRFKQLYEQEKKERQELEEEAKARAQFINVLAHELRTPLTPILLSVETLQDLLSSDSNNVKYKLINNTMNSVQSLKERLEELLDLARFTRGTFILKPQIVDTNEFLELVAKRYVPVVNNKKQKLITQISPGLPKIEVDPSRLEQVLLNLLSNASKYSPENTIITFKASLKDYRVMVEIKDQGIGITEEDKKILFTPYHRAQQDCQSYPGIGLGLAVTKQIIDAHGGKIWVESTRGKGCAFKFSLPVNTEIIPPDSYCADMPTISKVTGGN